MIGINTAIYGRSGGNMGIGFAIPINMTRAIMDSLIATGKVTRGFLGVVIQDITQDLADAMGVDVKEGVLIANVGPDSPAEKGGIQRGDVIVSFNGKPVKSSNALRNMVAAVTPGSVVPLVTLRDGEEVELEVKIGEQPEDMATAFQKDKPQNFLGMTLEPVSPANTKKYGYEPGSGLVVTKIEADSPAAGAGMREGTLILEVNRHPVATVDDFRETVQRTGRGKNLLLLVRLGGMSRFLVLKVP